MLWVSDLGKWVADGVILGDGGTQEVGLAWVGRG